jgi:hypothetical protein
VAGTSRGGAAASREGYTQRCCRGGPWTLTTGSTCGYAQPVAKRGRSIGSRPTASVPLAPTDPLVREIQSVLDLIRPMFTEDSESKYDGYCGAATEAYLHLSGGRESHLKVMRRDNDGGGSHWWLVGPRGVVDVTLSPGERREIRAGTRDAYPYDDGRGAMFQNGYGRPSKRAAAIIELVRSRRG